MLHLLDALKVIVIMVTELTHGQMETNTLGNGKMANKRHGKGTFTMEDGGTYVGTTKDGVPHGQGTYTWTDGDKYVGEFKDSKQHGQGTYTYADGRKYVGKWKDGKQHGQGTLTKSDGKKHVGKWKDGELHGKGTHTDGLMPKENKISVSKESVGRGAKSLSNIVAIFFGLGGATTGMFLGSSTYGFSWLTIVGAIIGFLIVYYFWKFVFWGLRSLISEFFN